MLFRSLFGNELVASITEGSNLARTKLYAHQLGETAGHLKTITAKIFENAQTTSPEVLLADATLYLDYFSLVTVGWMWLKQGIAAAKALENGTSSEADTIFYESKLATMRYYFEYELPKTTALEKQLLNFDKLTVAMETAVLV